MFNIIQTVLNTISNIFSIVMNLFNFRKSKLRDDELFICNIIVAVNLDYIAEHVFMDCMIANHAKCNLAITGASLSTTDVEFFSSTDVYVKMGDVQMANALPVNLQPDEMKRIVFEYEVNGDSMPILQSVLECKNPTLRVYTDKQVFVAQPKIKVVDLEPWLLSNKERIIINNRQHGGQLSS